jgi:hypothetical protein
VNSADRFGGGPLPRIANRYILAGAQYNLQVLAGLSAAQIASQLSNLSSPATQAIDGSVSSTRSSSSARLWFSTYSRIA